MTESNTIKITDIAMGISLFNSDYSEVRGRTCAPIRWQPWESILLVRCYGINLNIGPKKLGPRAFKRKELVFE